MAAAARSLQRTSFVALLTGACLTAFLVVPARADGPALQGWWWVGGTEGLPATVPTPPDVPAKGLLVEGGPAGAFAYAALLFYLAPGVTPSQLVMPLAEGAVSTPTATPKACALVDPALNEASGGALAAAPAYDDSACVAGKLDATGTAYLFPVAEVKRNADVLALALVPGAGSDRVVFAQPGPGVLTVTTAQAAPPSSDGSARPPSDPRSAPAVSGTPDLVPVQPAGPPAFGPPVASVPAPLVDTTAAPSAPEPALEPAAGVGHAAQTSTRSFHSLQLALLALALAATLTLWRRAGDAPATSLAPSAAPSPPDGLTARSHSPAIDREK